MCERLNWIGFAMLAAFVLLTTTIKWKHYFSVKVRFTNRENLNDWIQKLKTCEIKLWLIKMPRWKNKTIDYFKLSMTNDWFWTDLDNFFNLIFSRLFEKYFSNIIPCVNKACVNNFLNFWFQNIIENKPERFFGDWKKMQS